MFVCIQLIKESIQHKESWGNAPVENFFLALELSLVLSEAF